MASLFAAIAAGALVGGLVAAADTLVARHHYGSAWRASVVAAAEQMVGVPYRAGGRTPNGFDCSGLVSYSYARAGIDGLPRTAAGLYRNSSAVPLDQLRPGDLLFFSFGRTGISHVGVYVGDGEFVHAQGSGGSVERVRLADPSWRGQLARAGRPFQTRDAG